MLYAKLFIFTKPITSTVLVYRADITKYHKLGGFNNRNIFSHRSRGWKSKIKVLAVLVSSYGRNRRICSRRLSLACRWPTLLLHLHIVFPPCIFIPGVSFVCPISSSYKNTSQIRANPNSLILT